MTKKELLELIRLLSALESWSLSLGKNLPDHLYEQISNAMEALDREIMK